MMKLGSWRMVVEEWSTEQREVENVLKETPQPATNNIADEASNPGPIMKCICGSQGRVDTIICNGCFALQHLNCHYWDNWADVSRSAHGCFDCQRWHIIQGSVRQSTAVSLSNIDSSAHLLKPEAVALRRHSQDATKLDPSTLVNPLLTTFLHPEGKRLCHIFVG